MQVSNMENNFIIKLNWRTINLEMCIWSYGIYSFLFVLINLKYKKIVSTVFSLLL